MQTESTKYMEAYKTNSKMNIKAYQYRLRTGQIINYLFKYFS